MTGASFIECSSTAAIEIDASGAWVGGLIGQFDAGTNLVDRSFAGGSVDFVGQSGSNWAAVGGLVGGFWNTPTNSIVDSYSTAALSSRATGTAIQLGGIVGYMNTGSLTNSMALGSISGTTDNVVNGFVGFADAGPAPVTLTGNFWDTATTGVATDALEAYGELTGLGATELSTLATFASASWGIDSAWDPSISWFLPADSYPVLTWQGASASNPVSGSGGSGGSGGLGGSGSSGRSDGGQGPTADISFGMSVGALVEGATITINANGLQDTAAFDAVLRSTPQTLVAGNAVGGSVNTTVTIPAGLEAGWHTLTFSSTAADGSAFVKVFYFKISDTGVLLATSSTIPAELAFTGLDARGYGGAALLVVIAGLLFVAASAYRRRNARLS